MTNPKRVARSVILVLTLLTVSMPVAFAAADSTTTETAAPEEARGFDDWGLLGFLGLLGLLGLRRDKRNVIVDGTRK